jgi:V/A-type H+-transporting ATPase subunit I
MTGAWFGNLLDKNLFIKSIKDRIMLFDPLKQPLNFLFLSLALGFSQITFGIFLRFFKELKNNLYFQAFFLQLPSILLQISLLILAFIFLKIFPKRILPIAGFVFILSSLLIILYQFKSQKEFVLKVFWSIYSLYGIIAGNFLADTLSFCRIFALGLTTSLLATAINEIYFILPGILKTILIPAFILAHILNLGINLLGAYVHTSRLQYLEFFTKFFESQEEAFKPFKREFNFIQIEKGG